MANITSAYSIGVVVTADTADLATGAAQAETAIGALATTTEAAATDIGTSVTTGVGTASTALGTTLPAAAETGVVGLTTKATKFKAVGGQLGTQLAEGIAGGVTSGDAVGGLTSAISGGAGLLAITAATGVGAAAAVGVGIATTLIGGLIKGMKQDDAAFQEQVTSMFNAIEITAHQSMEKVKQEISEGFTFKATVDKFGGEELINAAELFGVKLQTVVELINGEMTPAAKDLRDVITETAQVHVTDQQVLEENKGVLRAQSEVARDILGFSEETRNIRRAQVDLGRAELGYARDTTGYFKAQKESFGVMKESSGVVKDNIITMAKESQAAAESAARYASSLSSAAVSAGKISTLQANGHISE